MDSWDIKIIACKWVYGFFLSLSYLWLFVLNMYCVCNKQKKNFFLICHFKAGNAPWEVVGKFYQVIIKNPSQKNSN